MKLSKLRTILPWIGLGGVSGALISMLIGATAVGVLGAGIGSPALIVFGIGGIIISLAVYGIYRLYND